jgi:choline kinase
MHSPSTVAVTLIAGLGSRLGRSHPKCLTRLADGETILARQIRLLRNQGLQIIAVTGFELASILAAHPDLLFVYNPEYDATNTSKSLLCALRHIQARDVIWLNGDVMFDEQVLTRLLENQDSTVAVNSAQVGEEEVKYATDAEGYVTQISKQVAQPVGESLGINVVRKDRLEAFRRALAEVQKQDYFEKGMELLIERDPRAFRAVDVSDLRCIEIDFEEDLRKANRLLAPAVAGSCSGVSAAPGVPSTVEAYWESAPPRANQGDCRATPAARRAGR